MKIIDPGHVYNLDWLDGSPLSRESELSFVKREGDGYPGNVGHYPGTTLQEVIRALIDRVKYLDRQVPDWRNKSILYLLRQCIWLLELRAAQRHHRPLELRTIMLPIVIGRDVHWLENTRDEFSHIESLPVCRKCLHIGCPGSCRG